MKDLQNMPKHNNGLAIQRVVSHGNASDKDQHMEQRETASHAHSRFPHAHWRRGKFTHTSVV